MPAFGRSISATPVFGQASPAAPVFGQTVSAAPVFGQTASAAPVFGQNASAAPVFGQTASAAPVFGQNASAAPMFGQTASAAPAVFGQNASAAPAVFGQNASAAPVFGQTASAAPVFGQNASVTPAFGQTAHATPAFGQTAHATPAFGQISTGTPAFGQTASTTSAFGQTASTAPTFGQTASAIPAFGQTASATPTFGLTGSVTPAFGQNASETPAFGHISTGTPAFGQTAPATPAFGQISSGTPAFGQTASTTPAFGQTATTTSAFGQTASATPAFGQTASTTSAFGQTALATPAFGQTASPTPTFGQTASATPTFVQTASATPAFGHNAPATSAFGQSISATSSFGPAASATSSFGQTASATPTFGQISSATPAFGQTVSTAPVFGQTSSNVFGHTTSSASTFGKLTTTSASIFGQTTTSVPKFGHPARSTSIFGQATSTSSMFEEPTTSAPKFVQTTTAASTVGKQSTASSMFGTHATSASVFGKPATSASIVGKAASPASIFGKPATSASIFGKPATSASIFGKPATSASIFGKPAAAESKSEKPSIFRKPTTSSGRKSTSTSLFGKPTTTTPIFGNTSSGQVVSSTANVFGQKSARGLLFGKPETVTEETKTGSQLFGKPTGASQGEGRREPKVLFGKKESGKAASADPSGECTLPTVSGGRSLSPSGQRRRPGSPPDGGVQKRAALKKQPGTGLFGRAIASVSSERTGEEATGKREETAPSRPPPPPYGAGEEHKQAEMGGLSPESLQKSGQRRLRRRSSVDVSSLVAISCKNVPTSCNNKLALHKHFSKFGTITRLYMTPSKSTATIHFSDHESAENAKKKGKMIKQGLPPMQIFLSTYSNRGSETGARTALGSTRMPRSSEVDDELASMRGTSDVSTSGFERLEHQRQQEKKKQQPSVSFRGHVAGGDVGMAIRRTKRKMDVGLLARGRAGKAKGEERKAAGMKPAASSEVQLEVKPVSMKTLINAVGVITEERLEILNNADKIIRAAKGTKKHADLASAVAIKGSCPDMCPERERYMREFQRRLSAYEIVPGTDGPGQTPAVDHTRAVKEYSRSSADQDMPLPHSVRPPAVLQITMDYLMTNVMDTGGEGRWQDWYDFLWDRTRGIRKDIIQQHLCDLSAADLTEKCTRLHIYCSERLCEEGPNVFDEKINNENLTKCLQSLKELYQDLARQHGISCPNEAEFRAYMVLMNLNEGDTLREVQELCQDVRESAHVRFATSVYAAVNNNNYIKFFKLVHSATFLSACIMHRYFTQVRTKALTIIMKAYCVPGRVIQYPLSDIVRNLAFVDNSVAAEFCSHHGLAVHDGQVAMDRHAFVQPEQAFSARRALHLVESKQTTSVGEVVCGGPLPPSTLHNPTSSFDANNRFHGGDLLVAAMETPATITETPQDRPPTESPPEDMRMQAEAATASLAVNILNEVINEMVQEMCSSLMSDADRYLRSVQSIASEILNDAMVCLARVMCGEVTRELWAEFEVKQQRERAEDDARRRALISAARDLACGEIVDEIMLTVVVQECSSIAQDQHGEVQRTLQQESSDRCTASLVDQLVAETITAEIGDIAETTYEVDVEDRLRQLDETAKAVELLVKARYFQCWRNQHAGRMRLKRSMLSFPSAPSMKDPPAQFIALLPASEGVSHDSIHLGKKAWLTLNSPDQVCANQRRVWLRVALFNYCKRVKHDRAWCPLDMVQVLHRQLTMRQAHATDSKLSRLFWKLVISLPETDGSPADDDLHRCDWLKAKFSKGAVPPNPSLEGKSEVLSLYTVDRHRKKRQSLSVYVRTVVGILSECDIETIAKKQLFMGCSALLFLLRAADFSTLDDDFWLEEQLRLKTALLTIPFSSSLPLVIMAPHPLTDHQRQTISIQLGLDMALKDGLISCIQVVAMETCVEEPEASRTLVDSVRWLVERCPRQLALKVTPLRDYVEDCLSQDFYTLIFQDLALRKRNGLLHQSVRAQIALYNSVVCHMVEQVTHPDLANTSWPQFEFTHQDEEHLSADWNSCEQFAALEAALLSLRLPQFEFGGEDGEDWEEACEDVREFVAAVTAQGGHDTALLSRTCWILRKLKRQSEDMHLTKQWKLQSRPCHVSVPWTDIILACIDYKMAQLECYDTSEREGNVGQEVKVCYLKDHTRPVTLPAAWLEATGAAAEQECVTLGDTVIWQRREDDSASPDPGLRSRSWTDDIGDKTITTTTNRLLDSIAEEQTASELFENRLRKILQPKMHDELLNISSQDTRDVTAIFGVTSLLSSPVFNLALTSKLDRRQERGGDAGDKCIPRLSLAANVEELNRSVESQKAANSLYEMKLRMYMNEDLLW